MEKDSYSKERRDFLKEKGIVFVVKLRKRGMEELCV